MFQLLCLDVRLLTFIFSLLLGLIKICFSNIWLKHSLKSACFLCYCCFSRLKTDIILRMWSQSGDELYMKLAKKITDENRWTKLFGEWPPMLEKKWEIEKNKKNDKKKEVLARGKRYVGSSCEVFCRHSVTANLSHAFKNDCSGVSELLSSFWLKLKPLEII